MKFQLPPETAEVVALRAEVLARPLPAHVAIIMDGNGRWAEERGEPRLFGHREGSNSVRATTRFARRLGIKYLTLYAFSAQNWNRPIDEVLGLMQLLVEYLDLERDEIMDEEIVLQAIGELDRMPPPVLDRLNAMKEMSKNNPGMKLTLALSYGGREELVRAARLIAEDVKAGRLAIDDVTEDAMRARLWTSQIPDPDVVIRTSGEVRLSNFLLYQSAYAELVAAEAAWPDFRERELLLAVREFQGRERRFGQTSAQLRVAKGAAAGVQAKAAT